MERSTARRLWTWVPLFGAFVVAWAVLSIPGVQSYLTLQGAPPLATAAAADAPVLGADLVFTCADGSTFTGEDLRGKPAVITVFATWCPPCMAEVPTIESLHAAMGDTATVLLVALDSAEDLHHWVQSSGRSASMYATVPEYPTPLDTTAIPMSVVLDPQGRLVSKITGAYTWDDPLVVEHIDLLAAEASVVN